MPLINSSIDNLTNALNRGDYVSCAEGRWQIDNFIVRFVRWLFRLDDDRIASVVRNLTAYIAELEVRRPAIVRGGEIERHTQKVLVHLIQDMAAAVDRYAQPYLNNRKAQTELGRFRVQFQGFLYRMGQVNDGKDRLAQADQAQVPAMVQIFARYKQNDPMYHDKVIQRFERQKIEELCRYPDLCRVIVNHPEAANHVFKIAVRENIEVPAVVEFPHTVNKLYRSHMTCRIGGFARKLLEVDAAEQKHLNLLVQGNKYSITDPTSEIVFRDRSRATVGQILESYKNLNDQPSSGEYDFFLDGLRKWNGHEWGPKKTNGDGYHSINYRVDKWWDAPDFPLFDTIAKEELERLYNIRIEGENNCVQVLISTRNSPGVTLQGHGFIVLYLPMPGSERYRVLPFGLYANQFPVTSLEKATFIGSTLAGTIVFPDPNYTYTRQKACLAQAITPKQAEEQLRRITLTKIHGGWFMWSFENCCFYAKNLFMNTISRDHRLYPIVKRRLFKVLFQDADSEGLIKFIRISYMLFQKIGLKKPYERLANWALGAGRTLNVNETRLLPDGRVEVVPATRSALTSKFGTKQKNNLPSVFHTHVERGEVPGAVLIYGHGRNAA